METTEQDLSPVIKMDQEGDLIWEDEETIMIDHELLVTSLDA